MTQIGLDSGSAHILCSSPALRDAWYAVARSVEVGGHPVAAMLLGILKVAVLPNSTDATDAVAVAVCHHFSRNNAVRERGGLARGSSDWGAFVRSNPERLKEI